MKEIYESPEIEIVEFNDDDIIQTSTNGKEDEDNVNHDDEGIWMW